MEKNDKNFVGRVIGWICVALLVLMIGYWFGYIFGLDRNSWPAWVQAIGSVFAIGAGVWVFHAQNKAAIKRAKNDEETAEMHLLRSLRDEVDVLVEIFTKRNGKLLSESKRGTPFSYKIPTAERTFVVYESCVGLLGKIQNDDLRRLIIVGYGRAQGFRSSIGMNNSIIERLEQDEHLALVYGDEVHKRRYEATRQVANRYGDSLRDIYAETLECVQKLMVGLKAEIAKGK